MRGGGRGRRLREWPREWPPRPLAPRAPRGALPFGAANRRVNSDREEWSELLNKLPFRKDVPLFSFQQFTCSSYLKSQERFLTMAITQFRLFKICTCLAAVLSFIKKLICRSGRGRKLSGDQITLPTTVDYSSVPKQPEVEDWSSWDEDAPTSVKIEGGNGNMAAQQNPLEQMEPDYFKDMTPTIRKTQKIVIKKREPLNFGIPEGNTGFSSRLAATQDIPFIHQSPELGDLDTWQENTNAWEEEEDAAWQAEEVLRQQKIAEREKRAAEQQRKKMEKEAQRLMKKEQNKIGVKLS
ncbi:receptor-binding cancer antigen expressed on SiSo cells isoform 1-T1 [Ciconia maguari]